MKGITIYLKENERGLLYRAVRGYIEMMETGDETNDIVRDELENGLETGLSKLMRRE